MKRNKLTYILIVLGVLLIAAAIITMAVTMISQNQAAKRASEIADDLYALMPDVKNSAPDGRGNVTMSMIEIEGANYVGVIDVPLYNASLPIYGMWETSKVDRFPCRYMGSMYDGSLIIGGSDHEGQFDFLKLISEGETVYVTDTTGARYHYVVSYIEITKDVSTEHLTAEESDLVLFARNSYALDYTMVCCKLKTT